MDFMGVISRGLGVTLYMEPYPENVLAGKALIASNHVTMCDIYVCFLIQSLHNMVVEQCLKKFISKVPGVGWWCRIMGFPTLSRTSADLDTLVNHRTDEHVLIYPEGTRLTDKSYAVAEEFGKKRDIPISKFAAIPRTRGTFALRQMEGLTHFIVQTIVYMDREGNVCNNRTPITFPHDVWVLNEFHPIDTVPDTLEGFTPWLCEQFQRMDRMEHAERPPKVQSKVSFARWSVCMTVLCVIPWTIYSAINHVMINSNVTHSHPMHS
jgi:1-acyl-sn-glycerol-3-phosphate acyltransferase